MKSHYWKTSAGRLYFTCDAITEAEFVAWLGFPANAISRAQFLTGEV